MSVIKFTKAQKQSLTFLLLLCVANIETFASAGGGGGGHSGGGGSSGGGGGGDGAGVIIYLLFRLILALPFPLNVIVIVAIVVALYFYAKNKGNASSFNNIPTKNYNKSSSNYFAPLSSPINNAFLDKNPGFDEFAFKDKVKIAFLAIQEAWMKKDISSVRKWISDGVYQRFTTQFVMMNLLDQVNTMEHIMVQRVSIDKTENDGPYSIVHVAIQFTMNDSFVSAKYPNLNDGGPYEGIEYWTFIKKNGIEVKDLYSTNNCPKCGGELKDIAGETAKCGYCGTITSLGDYDWILSEISQPDDYVSLSKDFEAEGKNTNKIRAQLPWLKNDAVQWLEDKASNAYMQVMTATVKKDPSIIRRFCGDEMYEHFAAKKEDAYIFNRLYLNAVQLNNAYQKDGKDYLVFFIKKSFQKVRTTVNQAILLNQSVQTGNEVMIMCRDTTFVKANGELYAHSCPSCSAPVADTTEIKCGFCGSILNSTKYEWIVVKITTPELYQAGNIGATMVTKATIAQADASLAERDYILNNMMIIWAADGQFQDKEQVMALSLARELGFDVDRIRGIFDMARMKQLPLRMPTDPQVKAKVMARMTAAAMADGSISEVEQAVLDQAEAM
jgi:predicted lipid-binding transport protein (Tim44 family)